MNLVDYLLEGGSRLRHRWNHSHTFFSWPLLAASTFAPLLEQLVISGSLIILRILAVPSGGEVRRIILITAAIVLSVTFHKYNFKF